MDIHASLRSLRMSPRKVRLVINTIRGLSATAADTRLSFLKKGAALPVQKLLRSAIANAEHNFHLDKEGLIVKTVTADGGPTLKRNRPRAFGRGSAIRKRTTHLMLILTDEAKKTAVKPAPKKRAPARKTTVSSANA